MTAISLLIIPAIVYLILNLDTGCTGQGPAFYSVKVGQSDTQFCTPGLP